MNYEENQQTPLTPAMPTPVYNNAINQNYTFPPPQTPFYPYHQQYTYPTQNISPYNNYVQANYPMPPQAIPTPHSIPSFSPIQGDQELGKILMAWYNAGYSTGRYQVSLNYKIMNKKEINLKKNRQ